MTNAFPSRLSFPETHPKPRRSRAEAARIIGAKSKGPKIAKGKAISSKNALREGVIAKRIAPLLNRGDERRDYVLHFQGLKAEFKPQTRSEMNLLELIARDFVLLPQVGQATIGQFMNRPRKSVERPLETMSDLLFEVDVIDQVCSGLERASVRAPCRRADDVRPLASRERAGLAETVVHEGRSPTPNQSHGPDGLSLA